MLFECICSDGRSNLREYVCVFLFCLDGWISVGVVVVVRRGQFMFNSSESK